MDFSPTTGARGLLASGGPFGGDPGLLVPAAHCTSTGGCAKRLDIDGNAMSLKISRPKRLLSAWKEAMLRSKTMVLGRL